MIYLWKNPERYSEKYVAEYFQDEIVDRYIFEDGKKLTKEDINGEVIFKCNNKLEQICKFDEIINVCPFPIVNTKIIGILNEIAPSHVQFFDVRIECLDGLLTNYKILNVTSLVKGIDHELSVLEKLDGYPDIIGFKYIEYNHDCLGKLDIARDAEYLSMIVVSEKIKQRFKEDGIKSTRFITPEEYYNNQYDDDGRRRL